LTLIRNSVTFWQLTKAVAENLGKAFLTIGQGIIVAAFASDFFGSEFRPVVTFLGLLLGGYTGYVGLYIIAGLKNLRD
jgi:hypothetical protein